jgi:hypothetical protein
MQNLDYLIGLVFICSNKVSLGMEPLVPKHVGDLYLSLVKFSSVRLLVVY